MPAFLLTLKNGIPSNGNLKPEMTFVITVDEKFSPDNYPEGFKFHKNGATFRLTAKETLEFLRKNYQESKFLQDTLDQINREIEFSNLSPGTKIFLENLLKGE